MFHFLWLPEHPGAQMGHGPGHRRMLNAYPGDVVFLDETDRNKAYIDHQLARVPGEPTYNKKGEPHRNPCLIPCDGEGRPQVDGQRIMPTARLAQAIGAQMIMRTVDAEGAAVDVPAPAEVLAAPAKAEPPGHEPATKPAFSEPLASDRRPSAGKAKAKRDPSADA